MCKAFAYLLWLVALLAPVEPAIAEPPAVMLGNDYDGGVDVRDYWVSEKLDGVRGRWDGARLWTRGGHAIAAPAWFTAGWPSIPLDGELWSGRGRFDELSGIVRAAEPRDEDWRGVRFMVFDLPAHPGPFDERLQHLRRHLRHARVEWLVPVEQARVAGRRELAERFEAVVAAGGEGLMLHHHNARYRAGRSDWLLKYKPHRDAEAQVVGHTAGRGKYAGMVGALVVERPDGLRFRIGSGLSDADRARPPPVGSHVTYRYSGLTSNGVPRFARFLRVRDELPPPDPD